jgi:hypothetical protein
MEDLRLDSLTVLYPGSQRYDLADRMQVVPLATLAGGDPRAVIPRARRR